MRRSPAPRAAARALTFGSLALPGACAAGATSPPAGGSHRDDPHSGGLCPTWGSDADACLRRYNVAWDDLLPESAATYVNTMPIGNGDVAANVWADKTAGSVSALIAQSGAWDESGELMNRWATAEQGEEADGNAEAEV
eukprot:gene33735-39509_t